MKKLFVLIVAILFFTPIEARKRQPVPLETRNIILMIGDGMGPAHVTALMLAGNYVPINIERATVGGFVKTWSANNRVTDSSAAATAYATGEKTNNGYLGVDTGGAPLETILEKAEKAGMATGLVATTFLEHATPAAFYAHNIDRRDYENIALQRPGAGMDVAVGESENLAHSTAGALEILTAAGSGAKIGVGKGFFLMVEGSHIDTRSHDNNAGAMLGEMRDFDGAVGVVFDYADAHPGTLVIVLADHETGGLTLPSGDENFLLPDSGVEFRWSTGGHSGVMVPILAYGTGAANFGGILDNTEVNRRMEKLLGLE